MVSLRSNILGEDNLCSTQFLYLSLQTWSDKPRPTERGPASRCAPALSGGAETRNLADEPHQRTSESGLQRAQRLPSRDTLPRAQAQRSGDVRPQGCHQQDGGRQRRERQGRGAGRSGKPGGAFCPPAASPSARLTCRRNALRRLAAERRQSASGRSMTSTSASRSATASSARSTSRARRSRTSSSR